MSTLQRDASPCRRTTSCDAQPARLLGARRARAGASLGAGALLDREQFFRSYLVAYLFWVGIALRLASAW